MKINKINKKLKNMNVQIALYFWLFSILMLGLISYVYYKSTMNIIIEHVEENTRMSIEQASSYIENHLEKIQVLSDILAQRPDIIEALESPSKMHDKELIKTFETVMQGDKFIHSITILSKDGEFLTNDSTMFEMLSEDYTKKPWYKDALNSKQMPVLTSIRRGEFTMDKDTWVISIARQIINEDGEHLGILLIDISYQFIEQYLEALRLGEGGYTFIINNKNKLLFHQDTSYFNNEEKISKLVEFSKYENGYKDDMGLVLFKNKIDNCRWTLVGFSSLEEAKLFKKQLSTIVTIISILLTILSLLISIILSRKVSKPVKDLENAIKQTGQKLEEISVNKNAPYEVQSLSLQYNAMLVRIKDLIDNLKSIEEIRRIESIKMLQSQINPHFLYNTLDTIVWLAEFEDSSGVIEVTKSLGKMLRMGLNMEQSQISLKEELLYSKNYLTIQEYRYGDRFDYDIQGDTSLDKIKVPKLILQPIIENAIYHGLNSYDEDGFIKISYYKNKENLIIEIADNGVGFDANAKKNKNKLALGGIGIENVNRRIKLICGDEYGLNIESEKNKGTKISYHLPANNISN